VPLTFSETNFTSEEEAIIEVNVPKFEGNTGVANKINSVIEYRIARAIARTKDESISTISEAVKSFDNEFKTFNEEFSEASQPWEAFADGEVTYQSTEIICVAVNTYINTGGAHGNSVISFLNFNPTNGELYKNEGLIKDVASLKTIAESHFNKMIKEREDADELNFQFPETIGFNDDGVIILLNSNGLIVDSPEFTIPYEELNDLLKVH
jgi:hypothetical protein